MYICNTELNIVKHLKHKVMSEQTKNAIELAIEALNASKDEVSEEQFQKLFKEFQPMAIKAYSPAFKKEEKIFLDAKAELETLAAKFPSMKLSVNSEDQKRFDNVKKSFESLTEDGKFDIEVAKGTLNNHLMLTGESDDQDDDAKEAAKASFAKMPKTEKEARIKAFEQLKKVVAEYDTLTALKAQIAEKATAIKALESLNGSAISEGFKVAIFNAAKAEKENATELETALEISKVISLKRGTTSNASDLPKLEVTKVIYKGNEIAGKSLTEKFSTIAKEAIGENCELRSAKKDTSKIKMENGVIIGNVGGVYQFKALLYNGVKTSDIELMSGDTQLWFVGEKWVEHTDELQAKFEKTL